MPFKANAALRHRIPKQRHRVANWAEYDLTLRQRGCLTVWLSEEPLPPGGSNRSTGEDCLQAELSLGDGQARRP